MMPRHAAAPCPRAAVKGSKGLLVSSIIGALLGWRARSNLFRWSTRAKSEPEENIIGESMRWQRNAEQPSVFPISVFVTIR
ncbi:MAG: hypothetical protein ACK4XK_12695, partial [Casimicrobiaceae bacterium]